jgi:hypothetical protein
MTHVVAFDFESFGPIPNKHGFTQLGAIVMRLSDRTILATFNEYATNGDGMYQPDERCMREFWAKNPKRLEETVDQIVKSNLSPHDVIDRFLNWVEENTRDLQDVYFLTDNAAYDVALLKHFAKQDILYLFGGTYREVVDVSGFYLGLSGYPVNSEVLNLNGKKLALQGLNFRRCLSGLPPVEFPQFQVQHTHEPSDDATLMACYWSFFQNELRKL